MRYKIMDINNFELYFILFAVANTYFSYRAGKTEGSWRGVVGAFQFLKDKNALKDNNTVIGFSTWPLPMQKLYKNPHNPDYIEIN